MFHSLGAGSSPLTERMGEGDGLGEPWGVCGVSADSRPSLSLGDRQVTSGSKPPPSGPASSLCLSGKEAGPGLLPCALYSMTLWLSFRESSEESVPCCVLHGVAVQPGL